MYQAGSGAGEMKRQYETYCNNLHWRKQVVESRKLVSDQLEGVSQVMEDLAKEIKREGQEMVLQEEQIREALEQMGLAIAGIDVINLEMGKVEIEIVHQYLKGFDECRKIIAPLLSDILGENIVVKKEQFSEKGEAFYTVTFGSMKQYGWKRELQERQKAGICCQATASVPRNWAMVNSLSHLVMGWVMASAPIWKAVQP